MANGTRPLTRKLSRPHDAPPVFLAAVRVDREGGRAVGGHGSPRTEAHRVLAYAETAGGAALAGLAGLLLIAALPSPDAFGGGAGALARSLLWLGGAGAVAASCIGGLLAAATRSGARAVARGLVAGLWGFWVGGVAALGAAAVAYRLWATAGGAGPVVAFPPGPLAMGPLAWVGVGTLWAMVVGWFLPFAPGHPGGRPGRACVLAGIAGLAGSLTAAQTGVVAPAVVLVAAAIGIAGRADSAA